MDYLIAIGLITAAVCLIDYALTNWSYQPPLGRNAAVRKMLHRDRVQSKLDKL